ncbi:unnamed protein product [Fusarium graminearum]|uniref:Chromosome 1, complete genome n=1 Tax=Gibberella zeae (strain ATCC MYA-4620 / CBS 123657 / FGSC 9075 / NRRL 31084 / PH-1) TaxID=229533 RepID=I1S4I1_GIBZE|nr:hypothetical protein FGSG_11748 [Fusarium graminearum PH-1]ESU05508.1 hypothetical protein FGSG_11748 [Fusarium graminearum PH-1]CEF72251.1 unnamed protein product [Fusarium graminearum]CZS75513.1 unnamed protein product [Fusarium graminearum]|eukprot:XP_011315993.1 hypothetical protein FGSG_11748 [Fusarium graminearum PH-1]
MSISVGPCFDFGMKRLGLHNDAEHPQTSTGYSRV